MMANSTQDNPENSRDGRLLSILPWGVSVLFHIGLVLLAIAVVWSNLDRSPAEQPPVIPEIKVLAAAPKLDQPRKPNANPTSEQDTRTPTNPFDNPNDVVPTDLVTGEPLNGGLEALSDQDWSSVFDAGSGVSGDDGVNLMGVVGEARSIAYVIDASGSLLDAMPFVIRELNASIRQLNDKQKFTVIFAQGDKPIEVPPRGLKKANHSTKQRVSRWVDTDSGHVVPGGSFNPVVAIKKALQYKPQLIFLLSDNITGHGRYEINQKRLVNQIQYSNTNDTKINTIQFLYPDPLARIGLEPTMKLISQSSGGVYRFIDGRELGVAW